MPAEFSPFSAAAASNSRYNRCLLTEAQRDRIEIVLLSPRNPLNIGAAARAMANFGFSHLTVVAPYEPHWREARSAIGAGSLLQNAKCVEHLGQALADCTFVVGTATLDQRRPEQPAVFLPGLAPRIAPALAPGGRVALVFGSEKRGLTRDDLALCHLIVEIPTSSGQPSMNLGQAVAVSLYELAAHYGNATPQEHIVLPPDPAGALAMSELDLLARVVTDTMQAANYSPEAMHKANRHDLDLLLRRLMLNRADARRILGLFRRILWRLNRN